VEREREIRSQLSRQAAAHNDHVNDVLRVQQHELETAFDVRLASLMDKERAELHRNVAASTGHMLGINKALSGQNSNCINNNNSDSINNDGWLGK